MNRYSEFEEIDHEEIKLEVEQPKVTEPEIG